MWVRFQAGRFYRKSTDSMRYISSFFGPRERAASGSDSDGSSRPRAVIPFSPGGSLWPWAWRLEPAGGAVVRGRELG